MPNPYYEPRYAAKRAEARNDWAEAARLWKLAGKQDEADTCQFIADSVASGRFQTQGSRVTQRPPSVSGTRQNSQGV